MKRISKAAIGAVVVVLLAQFIRPERTNPTANPSDSIDSSMAAPSAVLARLHRSCFDCHSNQTAWPWYSAITPVNFLLTSDVGQARQHLNFSEWGRMKPGRRQAMLDNMADEIDKRDMPLSRYLFLHPDARMTDDEVRALVAWASAASDSLAGLTADGQ